MRPITTIFALVLFLFLVISYPQPRVTKANTGGGLAYFTDGGYASRTTVFYYGVTGAPANVCGTLYANRNGVDQVPTPNWICTDNTGNATKGPYMADRDEFAVNIYIQWPDGTQTTGADFHVKDISDPVMTARTQGGQGVPISSTFSGTASDTFYGTGFNPSWTSVFALYYDVTSGLYYDGSCYCTVSRHQVACTIIQIYDSGYGMTWDCPTPPQGVHNAFHAYEWSAFGSDKFYLASAPPVRFDPPR